MSITRKIGYLITSFIRWIRPAFEGLDGKASHRRLTVFYFSALILYMLIATTSGAVFPEIAWVVVSAGAGLFSALSVWQNKVHNKHEENK